MRTVMEAAGEHEIDTTDGVRVVERNRGWALVLPDPADAVTHLWAEGNDADTAQLLLAQRHAAIAGRDERLRQGYYAVSLFCAAFSSLADASETA
jgi:phosphomannomutase